MRARLDVNGSLEYGLIWKSWAMKRGAPICALRASARRTSGKGFTGWPSARVSDAGKAVRSTEGALAEVKRKGGPQDLGCAVMLTGWPSAQARDYRSGKTKMDYGNSRPLSEIVQLAGWASPNAIPANRGGLQRNPQKALNRRTEGHMLNLDDQAVLAGWPSPMASTPGTDSYNPAGNNDNSRKTSRLAGWATVHMGSSLTRTKYGKQQLPKPHPPDSHGNTGMPRKPSTASTTLTAALNPEFTLWLMGYDPVFLSYAP